MHIVLTDVLTCPRCGPEFGVILLAERVSERRVLEGSLGCSNCRNRYPVRGGVVEMGGADAEGLERGTREEAFRLAALLALNEVNGFCAVAGSDARLAPALASLGEGVEVIAVGGGTRGWEEAAGVSRVTAPPGVLPFFSRSLRGVAVSRDAGIALEEAVRVVAPASRLVYDGASADADAALAAAGMEVLAREGELVVAARKFA